MSYSDPTGYSFISKLWNGMWDGLNNFAEWADNTDWFPSSGNVSVNMDNQGNVGYTTEVNGQETYNSRESYDYQQMASSASSSAISSMQFSSNISYSMDMPTIRKGSAYMGDLHMNWFMAGNDLQLGSINGDGQLISGSYMYLQGLATGRIEQTNTLFDAISIYQLARVGISALASSRASATAAEEGLSVARSSTSVYRAQRTGQFLELDDASNVIYNSMNGKPKTVYMFIGDKAGAMRYAAGKPGSTITAFDIDSRYANTILRLKHPQSLGLKSISASDEHVLGGFYRVGVHSNKINGFLKWQIPGSGRIIIP